MSLYTMGDLHLSENTPKPMDIFGGAWSGYRDKIINSMNKLKAEDVMVIPGDFSWGINLDETLKDFKLMDLFPVKKILIKGNHDLWWSSVSKMNSFLKENGIKTFSFLNNNSYIYDNVAICGTRGWMFDKAKSSEHDRKLLKRELIRLEASLRHADGGSFSEKLCFLHYPPVYGENLCTEMLELLKKYRVSRCFYGHLHGVGHNYARQGEIQGIQFRLVSADFIGFNPVVVKR